MYDSKAETETYSLAFFLLFFRLVGRSVRFAFGGRECWVESLCFLTADVQKWIYLLPIQQNAQNGLAHTITHNHRIEWMKQKREVKKRTKKEHHKISFQPRPKNRREKIYSREPNELNVECRKIKINEKTCASLRINHFTLGIRCTHIQNRF